MDRQKHMAAPTAEGAAPVQMPRSRYSSPPPRAAAAPKAWVSQLILSCARSNSLRMEWSLLLEAGYSPSVSCNIVFNIILYGHAIYFK